MSVGAAVPSPAVAGWLGCSSAAVVQAGELPVPVCSSVVESCASGSGARCCSQVGSVCTVCCGEVPTAVAPLVHSGSFGPDGGTVSQETVAELGVRGAASFLNTMRELFFPVA